MSFAFKFSPIPKIPHHTYENIPKSENKLTSKILLAQSTFGKGDSASNVIVFISTVFLNEG